MKKKSFIIVVLLCVLIFGGCTFLYANPNKLQDTNFYYDESLMRPRLIDASGGDSIAVAKNVSPAVVGITSATGNSYSIGSGVAIKAGGYVLTNSHVITNSKNIVLYLANGSTTTASLQWRDEALDLAIVKSKTDLPYLKPVENGNYATGEEVLAIGTPLSLEFKHTVTKGIISAVNRTLTVDSTDGAMLQNLIQHDASINPGNSGGPLINMSGQVIGINTLKVESAEGLGFAIPVSTAVPVVNEISANGTFKPVYMGIFGYDASLSNFEGKSKNKFGVFIKSVAENSPISLAGIKEGDVITEIDGIKIKNMLELRILLFKLKPANKVEIKYVSDGFEKTVKITLQERPTLKQI